MSFPLSIRRKSLSSVYDSYLDTTHVEIWTDTYIPKNITKSISHPWKCCHGPPPTLTTCNARLPPTATGIGLPHTRNFSCALTSHFHFHTCLGQRDFHRLAHVNPWRNITDKAVRSDEPLRLIVVNSAYTVAVPEKLNSKPIKDREMYFYFELSGNQAFRRADCP